MHSVVTGHAPKTCILPPFNTHGILWDSSRMKHTLAVPRSDMLTVRTFGLLERRVLACTTYMPLGVWLFWYSDGEYMKNSVPSKGIHPAGPLDWCQRPHVHRKPRGRRKSVSPFWSTFWGVVPLLSSALNIMYWCFIHGPTRMPKSLAGFVARVVSRTEWVLLSSLAVCSLLSDALSTDRWCQVTWSATVVWL